MDKDENIFADAFDGKLSTEKDALQYIRENGDIISSDPLKKQIAIDRIVDKVVYGKKDKPVKTFRDKLQEVRMDGDKNNRNKDATSIHVEIIHWIFIVYGILYSIGYIIFNFWI